jgi:hypothetical protein
MLACLMATALFSKESCYAVQLWSAKKGSAQASLQAEKGCRLYEVGKYTANRCGCFQQMADARKALVHYRRSYPGAYITKMSTSPKSLLPAHLGFGGGRHSTYRQALRTHARQIDQAEGKIKGLYGLELKGKYEEYSHQHYGKEDDQAYAVRNYVDYQHYIELNFSLFKDGFFSYRKEERRERQRTRIVYLQNLSMVMKNDFSDMKIFIDHLNSQINYRYYAALTDLYKERMAVAEKRYAQAMTENYTYGRIRQMYRRYLRYAAIYKKHEKLKMTEANYTLLREIDRMQLRSLDTIAGYAAKHSSYTRLTEAKNALLDASESYLDTVEVDIYAKQNRIDEIGSYNAMGVEVTVPLDRHGTEIESLNRLKQQSNKIAAKSFEKNIRHQIANLYGKFGDMQQFIGVDREDIAYFRTRIKMFEKLQKNMIEPVTVDPEMEILRARHKIIDLKFNILRTKAKLIALFYEMAYLSHMEDLSKMIKK